MRTLRAYKVTGYLIYGKKFSVTIIADSVDSMIDEFNDMYADCALADYEEVAA